MKTNTHYQLMKGPEGGAAHEVGLFVPQGDGTHTLRLNPGVVLDHRDEDLWLRPIAVN